MPLLQANGIELACECAGDPQGVPVLLIMGLGMQLIAWPDELVDGLVDLGFYVIRFDNRDSGLSTKFEQAGTPNLALAYLKTLVRWPLKSAYTLDDMASDALALLRALGIERAHVVGASMGAMVAQILAGRHPQHVLSLTSIMSSSSRRGLPGPSREARAVLMRRPADPNDMAQQIDHLAATFKVIGSPAYPTPDVQLRQRIRRALERNVCPGGVARQMVAIAASGERNELLQSIRVPTLIVHGAADVLVPLACGEDCARQIPGARLEVIQGMGHDLPAQLIERLLALIDANVHGKMVLHPAASLFGKSQ